MNTVDIAKITEDQITKCAKAALLEALTLHKITFFHSKGNMRIQVELDKPSDKYGSVNIRECETYARALKESLDAYELKSGLNLNYSLEVSSAGAERELLSIADVERFCALPLALVFTDEKDKVRSEVVHAIAFENDSITFKLADCKWNRKQSTVKKILSAEPYSVPWNRIKKIRLHLDV
ncbi:MAG TPA: hypothetical protein PLY93_06625 [Turneriella sp.]|nr:hypothetical protein [Turneriella sp.]